VFRAYISIGHFTSQTRGYRALRKIAFPVELYGQANEDRETHRTGQGDAARQMKGARFCP
jgi:hypothetical protein